jgi:hypothetical protein
MYVTDKNLIFHLKEVNEHIREVAKDLGGDIRYLNQEIHELREKTDLIEQNLEEYINNMRDENG